ncbi:hypothetical protein B0H10DRAFT_2228397 [Mycena sp. CBHHK59/15]|nr:hypothetical protein B0H10DRAFT_2228397 [Mycena sp. CBHHK59/15]
MVSVLPGSLSKVDEAVVRKLFKIVHATKYEDPVDQDAFLVESANTVLQFRPQVASFVLIPELGECVFSIRAMMHASSARLGTPFSDAFVSIQDFAGEILRKPEGMAASAERRAALEHASNLNTKVFHRPLPTRMPSLFPRAVTSLTRDEPLRVAMNPPSSPIKVDPSQAQPSSQAVLLSPLGELGFRLGRLTLGAPHHVPPSSPLSPSLSLPDLVPDFTLVNTDSRKRRRVEAGEDSSSGPSLRTPQSSSATPSSSFLVRSACPPPSPKTRFVDDWLLSRPKCARLASARRNFIGNSKPSVNPNRLIRHPFHKKVKALLYWHRLRPPGRPLPFCVSLWTGLRDRAGAFLFLLEYLSLLFFVELFSPMWLRVLPIEFSHRDTFELQVLASKVSGSSSISSNVSFDTSISSSMCGPMTAPLNSHTMYAPPLVLLTTTNGPHQRSLFLPLRDPSSTVFLTSTTSPGSNS